MLHIFFGQVTLVSGEVRYLPHASATAPQRLSSAHEAPHPDRDKCRSLYSQGGSWALGSLSYIQGAAETYRRLSRSERRRLSVLFFLWLRFQSRRLHAGLDQRTLRKARVSRRQLERYLKLLSDGPKPSAGGLGVLAYLEKENDQKVAHAMLRNKSLRPMPGRWWLADQKNLKAIFNLLGAETKARNTMVLHDGMTPRQIMDELDLKILEHHHAQVVKAVELGPGGTSRCRQRASKAVNFPIHPQVKALGPIATKYQAPIPMSSIAKALGVSVRSAIRFTYRMEEQGCLSRTKRRVMLPEGPVHPKLFHKTWGGMPFFHRGLWYAQFSNLYTMDRDYRGPYALLRRDRKGYGKSVSTIFEKLNSHKPLA